VDILPKISEVAVKKVLHIYIYILWNVDPLLGNGREKAAIQYPLLSNGLANKHVPTATIAQK
jgi:hypothetical protein